MFLGRSKPPQPLARSERSLTRSRISSEQTDISEGRDGPTISEKA